MFKDTGMKNCCCQTRRHRCSRVLLEMKSYNRGNNNVHGKEHKNMLETIE